jgi:DNA polymerase-3 subunit delta
LPRSSAPASQVAVYPIEREALPAWIAARLARQRQSATPETLAFLAERCEGNLIAARQEIEKLGLVLPEGELEPEAVERVVTDVARYDVFQLSEAWLTPDPGRALRIIAALKPRARAFRSSCGSSAKTFTPSPPCRKPPAAGTPVAIALRNARVWGKRQAAMERAARRVPSRTVGPSAVGAGAARRAREGIGRGKPWDELRTVAMMLMGQPAAR